MDLNDIYKIKDSVDLFLNDEKILTAYFMNTRIRKNFRISKDIIALLEIIDGEKSIQEICEQLKKRYALLHDEEIIGVLHSLKQKQIIIKVTNRDRSNNILERYDRQINYFAESFSSEENAEKAQTTVQNSTIAVFGCGAVGGNIAVQLAMAGVEHFILYDYDTVEKSDISRHIFYTNQVVGKKKIIALAETLKKINKKCNVQTIDECLVPTSEIKHIIEKATFVVNTLDEPYIGYTASKISRICIKQNKPHYIAGGFDAHLASTGELIIPFVTPCVECYSNHFKESLKGWKPKKHPVRNRIAEIGGLPSMTLFSSSFAAIEIIKCLASLVDISKSYKTRGEFLFGNMELNYIKVIKKPDCVICGVK